MDRIYILSIRNKYMTTDKDLRILKQFLEGSPKNKPMLAAYIGYRSTLTIDKWFARKQIPYLVKDRVFKFIEKVKAA